MSQYIIACGGTGGHLAPGIALAEGLTERGHDCHLIISKKQIDSRLVADYPDMDVSAISGSPFSLRPFGLAKFMWNQARGFFEAVGLIRKIKPDTVIGFGGFTTIGIAFAAFIMGCPVVLHEANRRAGKATRLLSVLARRVYLPPGVQLKSLPPKTIRHFGFPVRKEVRPVSKQAACQRLGLNPDAKRLLVMGGSQGAVTLNSWVLKHFEQLGAQGIDVYCITGLNKCSEGKLEYCAENGDISQAIFTPFVHNISDVLCACDLAISRAGAGSIAEFSRCYLPSILVPYPHAADDHQRENAHFIERQGGAIVLDQEMVEGQLYDEVVSLIFNDWLLDKLRRNLVRTEADNALTKITRDLETLSAIDSTGNSSNIFQSL